MRKRITKLRILFYILFVIYAMSITTMEAKAYTNEDVSNPIVRRMGKQLGWSDAYIEREGGYITYRITGINDYREVYTSYDGYGYGITGNNNRIRKTLSSMVCKQHMDRGGSKGNSCYILTYSDAPTCTSGGWIWLGCVDDEYSYWHYHTFKEQLVPDEDHRVDLSSHYGYYQEALGHDYDYSTWTYTDSNGIKNGMRYHKCNYCNAYTDLEYLCQLTAGAGIASVSGDGWYPAGSMVTINAIPKKGYTWQQWIWNRKESTMSQKYTFTIHQAYEFIALTTANEYKIHFDANGGVGEMSDMVLTYDVPQTLSLNTFTRNNGYGDSLFMGWNMTPDAESALYVDGEEIVNLTDIQGEMLTLYAIWDDCPWIEVEDMYYSLNEAQNGFITAEELLSHARACDRETGMDILPGIDEAKETQFVVIDYKAENFTALVAESQVKQTFQVIDSVGNSYKKTIIVHIIDTEPEDQLPVGTTRFISEKFYYENYEKGGLQDNSIWKQSAEYISVIESAFQNAKNNTPIKTYHFSYEEILKMK